MVEDGFRTLALGHRGFRAREARTDRTSILILLALGGGALFGSVIGAAIGAALWMPVVVTAAFVCGVLAGAGGICLMRMAE